MSDDASPPPPIRTCVFPIAGRKGAFQPATKSMPREMLPIIDTPLILHAVNEARAAGCERFVFVERPGAFQIRRFFEQDEALARDIEPIFGEAAAAAVRDAALPEGAAVFVEQDPARRGLGDAVACAQAAVNPPDAEPEPFAVILPDELVIAPTPVLAQMARRWTRLGLGGAGAAMLAGMEVARTEVARYGIMGIDDTGGDLVAVARLDEKPSTDYSLSNFAITGRYLLPPAIFDAIDATEPDRNGALQLTDAIAKLLGETPVWGFRFEGERFDCGSQSGLVRATIATAMLREELRGDTVLYMRRMLDRLPSSEGSAWTRRASRRG
ncbi:MAG: sugar phosphate nucleotidyltransferase [Pseudomonadota bacterium]